MDQTNPEQYNESAQPSPGPGRPTKYNEETVARLCAALADGMPIKSACAVAGIGVQTLSDWQQDKPELRAKIEAAKEKLREKCLKAFGKAIDEHDWRAADALMKLVFPEYRQNAKVEVTANASATNFPVLTVEQQAARQERMKRLRGQMSDSRTARNRRDY